MKATDPAIIDAARARHADNTRCPGGHDSMAEAETCDLTGAMTNVMYVLTEAGLDPDVIFPPEGGGGRFAQGIGSVYEAGMRAGAHRREVEFGVRNSETNERTPYMVIPFSSLPADLVEMIDRHSSQQSEATLAGIFADIRSHFQDTPTEAPPDDVVEGEIVGEEGTGEAPGIRVH